ncbi:hypothetical protein CBL_20666 [Carabus blaptoides fortunei]
MENEILKEIKELLSPSETATRDISGDRYMTISIAIPIENNIHNKIMDFTPTSNSARLLKTTLLSEINKRFGSIEQIFTLSVATILDPRFKTLYFKNPEDVAKSTNEIKKILQIALTIPASSDSSNENSSKETASCSLFDLHSKLVQQSQKKKSTLNTDMPDQLAMYLRATADFNWFEASYSVWVSCVLSITEQVTGEDANSNVLLVKLGTSSNDFRKSIPKIRSETRSGTNSVSTMRTRPLTSNGRDIMLSMWQVRPLAVDMDLVADFSVKWMVSFFRVCQVRCVMSVQEAPESISPWSRIPQTETAK